HLITRVYSERTDKNAPPPPSSGQTRGAQQSGQRGQPYQPTAQRGAQPPANEQPQPAQPQATPPQPGQPQPAQPQPGQGRGNLPRDPTRAGGNPKGELTPLMY